MKASTLVVSAGSTMAGVMVIENLTTTRPDCCVTCRVLMIAIRRERRSLSGMSRDRQDQPARRGQRVTKGLPAHKVFKAHQVLRVTKVMPDHKVFRVHQASRATRAIPVRKALREYRVSRVTKVTREIRASRALPAVDSMA